MCLCSFHTPARLLAGVGIQYVIPTLLCLYARKRAVAVFGRGYRNTHASYFRHVYSMYALLAWAAGCVVLVTVNHIVKRK